MLFDIARSDRHQSICADGIVSTRVMMKCEGSERNKIVHRVEMDGSPNETGCRHQQHSTTEGSHSLVLGTFTMMWR